MEYKKKSVMSGFSVFAVVLAMLFCVVSVSPQALAAGTNAPVSFTSALLLNATAGVPSATVNFAIQPGAGVAAVPGTSIGIISPTSANGVTGSPVIGSAVYAPEDTTVTSYEGITVPAGYKADVKTVGIDFSGVSFSQPGIFRYVITEPSSGSGLTYDTQLNDSTNGTRYTRIFDVFVTRVDNLTAGTTSYNITGSVLHETANPLAEGATSITDKSPGFVHEYLTSGITLECIVAGNQASKDKYFKFEITMDNPNSAEFSVDVDWSDAAAAQNPEAVPATTYSNATITAANEDSSWTSDSSGSLTKTVYLNSNQKIAVSNIPIGIVYEIKVTEEDYSSDWNIKIEGSLADSPAAGDPLNDTDEQTLGAKVQDVQFILTRSGSVPTGIVLESLPGLLLSAAAAAIIVMFGIKKRRQGTEA